MLEKAGKKWTESKRLQFAAFMVAAPRYMAMGAMALGIQLTEIHWLFIAIEVASWLGFAVLEGYAIPYIAKGIRRIEKRSFEWWQLSAYRVLLLLAIPVLGSPLYLAISQKQTILTALGPGWFVIWSFILCGIGALIIDAVGTVETVNEPESNTAITTRSRENGRVAVEDKARFLAKYYHEMTPDEFGRVYESEYGHELTLAEAEAALLAAQPVSGRRNGKG